MVDQLSVSAGLNVPFIRTRSRNLFGRIGLDWTRSDNRTALAGVGAEETDRLLVLDAGLSFDRATTGRAVDLAAIALRQGLDVDEVGVGGIGAAAGEAGFTLLQANLSRLQPLPGLRWSVLGELRGQYAFDVLPNGERFALGGATIGRGFAPGNTSGDSGYGLRVELRRALDGPASLARISAMQAYGYADYGKAFDRSVLRDGDKVEGLGSVGLGLRVDIGKGLTLTTEIARQTAGRPSDTRDGRRETRLFPGAVGRF